MNTLQSTCFQFQENDEASKECIKLLNTYKGFHVTTKIYGHVNIYYGLIEGKRTWSEKEFHSLKTIPSSEYLALLQSDQPKQLTVEDLKVGNRFMCIENMYDNNAIKILFEKGKTYKCVKFHILNGIYLHNNYLNRHFILHSSQPEIVPVQESERQRNIIKDLTMENKKLTESDLIPNNVFECIKDWRTPHGKNHFNKGQLYTCNEAGTLMGEERITAPTNKALNEYFKLVPVQEEVKGKDEIEILKNILTSLYSKDEVVISNSKAIELIMFLQQTAHLQQQLIVKDNIIGNKNKSLVDKADLINERDKIISDLQQQLKEAKEKIEAMQEQIENLEKDIKSHS